MYIITIGGYGGHEESWTRRGRDDILRFWDTYLTRANGYTLWGFGSDQSCIFLSCVLYLGIYPAPEAGCIAQLGVIIIIGMPSKTGRLPSLLPPLIPLFWVLERVALIRQHPYLSYPICRSSANTVLLRSREVRSQLLSANRFFKSELLLSTSPHINPRIN